MGRLAPLVPADLDPKWIAVLAAVAVFAALGMGANAFRCQIRRVLLPA